MKQQQKMFLLQAKKLSRADMKKLQGGNWGGGLWVCVTDGYRCSFYQWECEQSCSNPEACLWADYCP